MRSQCQTSSDLLDIPSKQAVQLGPDPDPESEKIKDTGFSGSIPVENTTDSEVRPLIVCLITAGGTFNDSEIAGEDHERRNSELAAQIEVLQLAFGLKEEQIYQLEVELSKLR